VKKVLKVSKVSLKSPLIKGGRGVVRFGGGERPVVYEVNY
jgi:hypothetical protein